MNHQTNKVYQNTTHIISFEALIVLPMKSESHLNRAIQILIGAVFSHFTMTVSCLARQDIIVMLCLRSLASLILFLKSDTKI